VHSRRRAFVVVMDACGIGALPDAADYGDADTNTLAHVAEAAGGLDVPTLASLGLGGVAPLAGVPPADRPAVHGRLHPLGPGKDSTTGHWEMMGASVPHAPVYPDGFPPDVIGAFEHATGRRVVCNAAVEGLQAIDEHGGHHLRTGDLIVYTSQDSVFQVAAHTEVVPETVLYEYCRAARAILTGPHAVSRVIARPFEGAPGAFRRTAGRRDLALAPPARTYLDELRDAGVEVHSVGKVSDLFGGRGFDHSHGGADNAAAIAVIDRLATDLDEGFVFANLIDTDQLYGHRKDVSGFARALATIDAALARWLAARRPGDLIVVTADHGCDPAHPGTDHTREHAPLLATFDGVSPARADGPLASVGASVLQWLTRRESPLPGEPFVSA
jgi:phosphopentomutase